MNVFDKIQPYVSSEDGELFDVALNSDEVSFMMLELNFDEIHQLCEDIIDQLQLLKEAYRSSAPTVNEVAKKHE